MKKTINTLICISLIQLNICPLYGQSLNLKINQNLNMNSNVSAKAIVYPKFLKIWDYPPIEPPYIYDGPVPGGGGQGGGSGGRSVSKGSKSSSGGGSSSGMGLVAAGVAAPIVIGGGLLAFFLTRGGSAVLPPISPAINPQLSMNNVPNFYNFQFGEEIIYNMVFKNTSNTPIYADSIMYVKVPAWIDYKPDSTYINNVKLSDLAGDDILTYFKDESLLVFNIGSVDTNSGVSISFGGKVLTNTVSKNEAFCLVKFQSVENNYETEWKNLSLMDNKPLPPVLQKVISTK